MSSRFFVRKSPRSKLSPPELNWITLNFVFAPVGRKECLRSLARNSGKKPIKNYGYAKIAGLRDSELRECGKGRNDSSVQCGTFYTSRILQPPIPLLHF